MNQEKTNKAFRVELDMEYLKLALSGEAINLSTAPEDLRIALRSILTSPELTNFVQQVRSQSIILKSGIINVPTAGSPADLILQFKDNRLSLNIDWYRPLNINADNLDSGEGIERLASGKGLTTSVSGDDLMSWVNQAIRKYRIN